MLNPFVSRAFWWSSALLVSAGVFLSFYAADHSERLSTQNAEKRLEARAVFLASLVEHSVPVKDPVAISRWLNEAAERPEDRLTLLDSSSQMIAQSGGQSESFDGIEVKEALAGRSFLRRGPHDLFFAVPVHASPAAVLHIAASLSPVENAAAELRKQMFFRTGFCTLTGMTVVWLYLSYAFRSVDRLKRFAENLLQDPTHELPLPAGDNTFGELSRTLRGIHPRVQDLIVESQKELALRQSILSTMTEGVLAIDRDLRITFGNENFLRCVHANGPLAIGEHVVKVVRSPEFIDLLVRALGTGETQSMRMELKQRRYAVQAAPLSAVGIRGAIAVLQDVTELERLERIRRDFVVNISHELRTPLAAIHGYAETLLDGGLDDPQAARHFTEVILRHASRLTSVSSDLLTLGELETAFAEADTAVPVRQAVQSAIRVVQPEANLRNIDLVCGDLADISVLGNRLRLEQALVNLLSNGVRFNTAGGSVFIKTDVSPQGEARISVADTGIGIPSDDVSRIFERFYRVDRARSRDTGGTGLGLSIVKHVIEQMHGHIVVESELGKGSEFTIVLPTTSVG